MNKIILIALLAILLPALVSAPTLALAASGLPNSPEFGYGVRLDLTGEQIIPAIAATANSNLDWIAMDIDWASLWLEPGVAPRFDGLAQAITQAQQNQLSVLVSITHPPAWAMTPSGPDPLSTALLASMLVESFPNLMAIELFPAANTVDGWGSPPDPLAYLHLLQFVSAHLRSTGKSVVLVAAGLTPIESDASTGDMDDLAFLEALYTAGAKPYLSIIGMRFPRMVGNPMLAPSPEEHFCIRHFEEVRQIMLKYDHRDGLIWLTSFSWPKSYSQPEEQTQWLVEAFHLLKAQLYVGAAFFNQINPPQTGGAKVSYLLQPDLSVHPALNRLSYAIVPPTQNGFTAIQSFLTKRIVQAIDFKPNSP